MDSNNNEMQSYSCRIGLSALLSFLLTHDVVMQTGVVSVCQRDYLEVYCY